MATASPQLVENISKAMTALGTYPAAVAAEVSVIAGHDVSKTAAWKICKGRSSPTPSILLLAVLRLLEQRGRDHRRIVELRAKRPKRRPRSSARLFRPRRLIVPLPPFRGGL